MSGRVKMISSLACSKKVPHHPIISNFITVSILFSLTIKNSKVWHMRSSPVRSSKGPKDRAKFTSRKLSWTNYSRVCHWQIKLELFEHTNEEEMESLESALIKSLPSYAYIRANFQNTGNATNPTASHVHIPFR